MMGQHGISMNITCLKDDILTKLKENLEQHSKQVSEARIGYVVKAKSELEKRLDQLKEGKIISLTFQLRAPKDYSSIYKTAIAMLTSHTGETIALSATEYRKLVEDEWDWSHEFFGLNSAYSASTREYGMTKGVSFEEE